jgi:glycosyltransferase involved in cell wall biosynthesis
MQAGTGEPAAVARLVVLLHALGIDPAHSRQPDDLHAQLVARLESAGPPEFWLASAVLTARLPTADEVRTAVRRRDFDGPTATVDAMLDAARGSLFGRGPATTVEVVTGAVLVDVHHTAQTSLATGIQRVARESTRRWNAEHELILTGWTKRFDAMRRLDAAEANTALTGAEPRLPRGDGVLVPWRCVYVLPELMTERQRALRVQALADFSCASSAAIGFDCVPLTSAETTGAGMGAGFAVNLTALARMDRIAAISEASATEYRGWRRMLGGAGLRGPEVSAVPLAVEASATTPQALESARVELDISGDPMILVVGSHEPRKNHLAVLHAAEVLWREGLAFSLVFVGGASWNSDRFDAQVSRMRQAGRALRTVSKLADATLWAAYRLARFTMFPSLTEGFGLPVAESLACGTPVVTAAYGSMAEIARGGGALLVDPRDDHSIAGAFRSLLTDDVLLDRLRHEAQSTPLKSWDSYASEVWQRLIPAGSAAAPGTGMHSG